MRQNKGAVDTAGTGISPEAECAMRDFNAEQENRFFQIFANYYDQEKTSTAYNARNMTVERMLPLAALAGHPEKNLRVIHLAGTKGKGSTTFLTAALLQSASHKAGCFTSPHLATVRERFQIANQLISYETLLHAASAFEEKLRQEQLEPTLFEIMTVLALQLFAAAGCDYAIMETGIGGLLDATNYVEKPACTGITSISFDHVHLLGNTIQAIATQKAGIIKPRIPVVCGKQPFPAAEEVVKARAEEMLAPFIKAEVDQLSPAWRRFFDHKPQFQLDNFATAYQICLAVGVTPNPDSFCFPELRARCEVVQRSPPVILDAAHNVDSARKTAEALKALYPSVRFTVILGVVKTKNAQGILEAFQDIAEEFILTNPISAKGSRLKLLQSLACKYNIPHRVLPSINSRQELPTGKPLLFTGSFFTAVIGERLFHRDQQTGGL